MRLALTIVVAILLIGLVGYLSSLLVSFQNIFFAVFRSIGFNPPKIGEPSTVFIALVSGVAILIVISAVAVVANALRRERIEAD